jgi:hypothetical protein
VDGDLAAQQRLADCDFQNKGKRFDERAGKIAQAQLLRHDRADR